MVMNWLRVIRLRVRSLLNRAAVEEELNEELRFHLEMQAAEYERQGMSPGAAWRRAVLDFGGVEGHKEAARDARGLRLLEEVVADVRYAARSLRRAPLLTAAAVLTLALALGANSALFGLIDAAFFRLPTGIAPTDRLVWLDAGQPIAEASYPDFRDVSAGVSELFTGVAAYTSSAMALGTSEEPVRVAGQLVSPGYFRVLGATPALGRGFLEEEGRVGDPAEVVVLGHRLWTERFGGDPGIVGRTVALNGHRFVVVGIAPPGFVGVDLQEPADLWVPAATQPVTMPRGKLDPMRNRSVPVFRIVARLRPRVSAERASGLLDVVGRRVSEADPDRHQPLRLRAVPLRGWMPLDRASDLAPMIGFAWLITAVVLVIACANVANLLLARAVARRREIGIRLALGAGRGRLVRLLLAEALLLSLAGAAVGLLVAYWTATWFRLRIAGPWGPLDVSPDLRSLAFTLALATLTGIAFGLVPAVRASRPEVTSALKGDGAAGLRRARIQGSLVVLQLALSVVLLTSAALFLRRLQAQQRYDVGYDTENVLSLAFDLEALGYSEEARATFYDELRRRAEGLPGIAAVSVPTAVPLTRGILLTSVALPGEEGPSASRRCDASAELVGVAPRFFRTLGIPLRAGREFGARDLTSGERTAVVSEALARACWPGEDPVGKRILLGGLGPNAEAAVVLGVAGDIALTEVGGAQLPQVYVPVTQAGAVVSLSGTRMLVRTVGDPARVAPLLRSELRRLDSRVPVTEVRTMADVVDERIGFQRRLTGLVAGFGGVALLLAALGLYGVVAFTVAGRTREIGVRIALGARSAQVVRGFVRGGLRLALVGAVAGAVIALGVARVLRSITTGIDAADPALIGGVGALLGVVALIASWLPARRAARVDPMVALRAE
jgi:predicted permease